MTVGGFTNTLQVAPGDVSGGYTTDFADVSGPIVVQASGDATTNYLDVGGTINTPSRCYRVRLVP